jgi:hypothetical protein
VVLLEWLPLVCRLDRAQSSLAWFLILTGGRRPRKEAEPFELTQDQFLLLFIKEALLPALTACVSLRYPQSNKSRARP